MNKEQRDYWYPLIVWKPDANFGPYCRGCSKHVWKDTTDHKLKPQGIIDHINGDHEDTRLNNLQLLCRSCNRVKNPEKFVPDPIKTQSEITNEKEQSWRDWLLNKCAFEPDGFSIDTAIASGAELFKVSPETIERRWLRKITSEAGKFIFDQNKNKRNKINIRYIRCR